MTTGLQGAHGPPPCVPYLCNLVSNGRFTNVDLNLSCPSGVNPSGRTFGEEDLVGRLWRKRCRPLTHGWPPAIIFPGPPRWNCGWSSERERRLPRTCHNLLHCDGYIRCLLPVFSIFQDPHGLGQREPGLCLAGDCKLPLRDGAHPQHIHRPEPVPQRLRPRLIHGWHGGVVIKDRVINTPLGVARP